MTNPRLFAVPLGAPYPSSFVDGFLQRMPADNPTELARATIIVNSGPMGRAIRDAFLARGPTLLPRILPLSQIEALVPGANLPPAVDPITMQLELARLVQGRIAADPALAGGGTAYDIAGSLIRLLGEMASEGVSAEDLQALDVDGHSDHWARNLAFIKLVDRFLAKDAALEAEARQRKIVEALIAGWRDGAQTAPIFIAGSTGSRGTTRMLIEAAAKLPNGHVVLPGFDQDLPPSIWKELSEDHPQYRYAALMSALEIGPQDVSHWAGASIALDRKRVLSLALRPPPITDQWIKEGPHLPHLPDALSKVTLIEAASPQEEAQAIALGMRAAVEAGNSVALVSPDRRLTRRVSAALDRWGIEADDSAGRPLALSAPGRLLIQVSTLTWPSTPFSELLALLKHPLVATGADRGAHLLMVRELEIWARRRGVAFASAQTLTQWAKDAPERHTWVGWVLGCLPVSFGETELDLGETLAATIAAAEALAAGHDGTGTGGLWDEAAGDLAREQLAALIQAAPAAGLIAKRDFRAILAAALSAEVRSAILPHDDVVIRGTLEARLIEADVVILAGLNEKTWPPADDHDPWLNRSLRKRAGLLTPDRRTGLSAHDFEQGFGATELWLSRTRQTDDGETVPARWLNRLKNLVDGLPERDGPAALEAMAKRGADWLTLAQNIDRRLPIMPTSPRPAPAPPVAARPKSLSVTAVERLIRDPYAIYARYVLDLRALPQAPSAPDARLRGEVLHQIADRFTQTPLGDDPALDRARLMKLAAEALEKNVPWPATRFVWLARLDRIADVFLTGETQRQLDGTIVVREQADEITFGEDFKLVGRADRMDRRADGIVIYDYKTGKPPTADQIRHFDRQLLLEALMVERGAFGLTGPVVAVGHIGLGSTPTADVHTLGPDEGLKLDIETISAEFAQLLKAYTAPDQGYASRRIIAKKEYVGDYDHLARYGEWDEADTPTPTEVGQ